MQHCSPRGEIDDWDLLEVGLREFLQKGVCNQRRVRISDVGK